MPMLLNSTHDRALLGIWEISESVVFFEEAIDYRSHASNPGKRLQQLASRMILDVLQPGFPFSQITLNPAGKPIIETGTTHFSISHTIGFAAAIIASEVPVGIDIEHISPRVLKVERKFLNEHEFSLLSPFSLPDRIAYASLFWSIKETVYKCKGKGGVDISHDISIISFLQAEKGVAQVKVGKQEGIYPVHYQRVNEVWFSHMQAIIQ